MSPRKPTIQATDIQHAKSLLSPGLKSLGPSLAKLFDPDLHKRDNGFAALQKQLEGRKLSTADALAIVRLVTEVTFPPMQFDWNDPVDELVFTLVENPGAALVAPLRAAYPKAPDAVKRATLAVFGATATRPAAEAFVTCIRDHGWPANVYGRVFTELSKLEKFSDVLFPELMLRSGALIGDVTNVLISALTSGELDPRQVDLSSLAPLAIAALPTCLAKVRKLQGRDIRWRFMERYQAVRTTTGAWLDIAGHVPAKQLGPLLERATKLRDPKLVAFAALSLVRRKHSVAAEVFERIAADHETRELLYDYLRNLGALAKFPAKWRTWDAFAAAEMARWLMYPSELGYVPERIELMQKFTAGKQTLYVWKFLDGKTWRAGVSGPYVLKGAPRPVWGASTFSQFERASSKTAEQHALTVLETLALWNKAHTAEAKKRAKRARSRRRSNVAGRADLRDG
ncbi:MAG: hypothetical protein H0T46_08365 [Deltaproteobacteria bacterium]|nr:hypothetical protein [Deltaproteobacteria bacterium]